MNTDLNSLLIFAQVVESNSFSRAALRLRVPISTVSRRVSDLEKQLGVRLIERSTRRLRLTNVGSEVFEHAQRTSDINSAVINIASNHVTRVSGTLRVSAPSTVFDSVLAPTMCRFQELYPDVRVQVFVTERVMNQIEEGIDLAFRVGPLENSSLVVRHLLCYRHRLVTSPTYLKGHEVPRRPKDLLQHRLVAFTFGTPQNTWSFSRSGGLTESIVFQPHLSINDYSELAYLLVTGAGIGELPPIVQPELLRDGRLVEVMPRWRLQPVNLSVVHLGNRYISRPVRLFKELAIEMVPTLFPTLTRLNEAAVIGCSSRSTAILRSTETKKGAEGICPDICPTSG